MKLLETGRYDICRKNPRKTLILFFLGKTSIGNSARFYIFYFIYNIFIKKFNEKFCKIFLVIILSVKPLGVIQRKSLKQLSRNSRVIC